MLDYVYKDSQTTACMIDTSCWIVIKARNPNFVLKSSNFKSKLQSHSLAMKNWTIL